MRKETKRWKVQKTEKLERKRKTDAKKREMGIEAKRWRVQKSGRMASKKR